MAVKISGASDDLIEIEGDVYEEFTAEQEGNVLGLSNGVMLYVKYDDFGVWRITPLHGVGSVSVVRAPANDDDNYSDIATVDGDIEWVVAGTRETAVAR